MIIPRARRLPYRPIHRGFATGGVVPGPASTMIAVTEIHPLPPPIDPSKLVEDLKKWERRNGEGWPR
jgi:hypothetical protein